MEINYDIDEFVKPLIKVVNKATIDMKIFNKIDLIL